MKIKAFLKRSQKLIIIFIYLILIIVLWKLLDEIYIFIFSILIILFYIVFSKLLKLILLRHKKVPGAGINLKLTFAFIFITSLPLILILLFTFDITNQLIESTLNQPFGPYLERLKTLSSERLSKNFENYVETVSLNLKQKNLISKKKKIKFEQTFSNYVDFNSVDFFIFFTYKEKKIDVSFSKMKKKTIYQIENHYKRFLTKDLEKQFFKIIREKGFHKKKNSWIDDKLQVLYHIMKLNQSNDYYLFLGKYIDPIDLEIAENIKYFYRIYHQKKFTKKQAITDFEKIILLIGLPTLLIAILISFFLARSLLKPIEALIIGTKEVAKGNLNYNIKELGKGELGELINSFNFMINELLKNKRELYRIEKVAAWREVAKTLAHEIKNPLTPIKLACERLNRQHQLNNENFAEILGSCSTIIISEVERLRKLVNEFSEFARLPNIVLKKENIVELTNKVFTIYKASHPNILFQIKNNLSDKYEKLLLDKEKIKQVLINLVENSLDAGNENIKITASLTHISVHNIDFCQITISDNGKGIPRKNMIYLFEPYFSTKMRGSGIGLTVVKNIIAEHKGHIYVQSVENEGSTFYIEIPYEKHTSY